MAIIAEKLYPPIISESIPPFYEENGVAKITIPFSMNPAVSINDIQGFKLKIKTVFSNSLIAELENIIDPINKIENNKVSFSLTDFSEIKIGQFFKVQLAYIKNDNDKTIGYYSTVGIIKYTSKPSIKIQNLNQENNIPFTFFQYVGEYTPGEDITEKPYSYNFSLYDENDILKETSGWLLHNSSLNINNIFTDIYSFKKDCLIKNGDKIQYSVRTINNLEISSPKYIFIDSTNFFFFDSIGELKAENIFDEGYIQLSLQDREPKDLINLACERLQNLYDAEDFIWKKRAFQENPLGISYFIRLYFNNKQDNITFEWIKSTNHIQKVETEAFDEDNLNQSSDDTEDLNNVNTIIIFRSSDKDDFQKLQPITSFSYNENTFDKSQWSFKDFSIEQGVKYRYCFRAINSENFYSELVSRNYSNEVLADFEDMFLWDGEKQIKIRFNPKVSSFKTTLLESKTDTIGSQYPVIFRNGNVKYKEFSLSGLISYKADENELFIDAEKDLKIVFNKYLERTSNPEETFSQLNVETSNLTDYNIFAERQFKLKVLDWLGDGKIKMFKSPVEGNYLVRLLNISLSPTDTVGRMLHTFSCTAYEVKEYSYDNLVNLNFIQEKAFEDIETLNYSYLNTVENKQEVGILIGPDSKSQILIPVQTGGEIKLIRIKKYYALIFKKKENKEIYYKDNKYYEDNNFTKEFWGWNEKTLYKIYENENIKEYQYIKDGKKIILSNSEFQNLFNENNQTNNSENGQLNLNDNNNSSNLVVDVNNITPYIAVIKSEDGREIKCLRDISEEGYVLNLDESNHYGKDYYSINIGLGLYLEYACQNEIITTNTNAGSSEGGV